jgi:geranylgeranylglycerol-phosphate geranylgeranyltransferase
MGRLISVLKLTRIEHSVMLIMAVVAAEILSGGLPGVGALLLSLITPIFLSMGAFAVNDYFDMKVDAENGRMRPLLTGDLKPTDAIHITAVAMAIGILGSLFLNAYCLVIAIIFGALSILYSYRLKELPLVGNACVAFSMAIPFVFGNYVVTSVLRSQIVLIFFLVFMSGLAREIHGTVRDFGGDRKRKALTLPKVIGLRNSAYLGFALYVIAISLTVYLFLNMPPFEGNPVYAVLILASDIMLFYSGMVYALLKSGSYDMVRNVSLAGMALALVCILISALVYT